MMAVLFIDGFSHYATSDIQRKWTSKSDFACTWTIEPTEGRNGGCLKRISTGNNSNSGVLVKSPNWRQTGVWSPQRSGICGFAIKIHDLSKVFGGQPHTITVQTTVDSLFGVWNGSWTHFVVSVNADGTLSVWRGAISASSGVGLLATTIGALVDETWTYLEFKWTLSTTNSATDGSLVIRANGIEILNYSGVLFATNNPGFAPPTAEWTSVYCFGMQSVFSTTPEGFLTLRVCDFYLSDQVAPNNNFLGDISISYIKPNGVGAASTWTPTPAVSNYQNVDEAPPTDDTDYNSATTVGLIDSYEFENCNPSITPIAVQQCILMRRTVPGAATIKSVVRQGSTNYESPAQPIPNETYFYNCFPYDTNPATGTTFTRTEIDNGQFGVDKVT